jgi:hypothetical protein
MFTIFDDLFLLSLHGEKCTLLPGISKKLKTGLSGAILAELVVQGKLQAVQKSKLELVDPTLTGDEILDEAMKLIQKSEKPRKPSYWIERLNAELHPGKKQLLGRLVSEDILSQADDVFSWKIPYGDSPNPRATAWFLHKSHLRELVLTQGDSPLCQLALLSILRASKLLRLVFTRDERKFARSWIYAMLMDRAMKEPAAQSLQEIEAAVETQIEEL